MKKVDAAWLAGLIDGEGSISMSLGSKNKVSLTPSLVVAMTTPSVLREIVRITGFGKVSRGYQNGFGRKPIYRWGIVSRQAASVLRKLIPFLRLKRKQALLVLKVMDSRQGDNHGTKYGRGGLPSHVHTQRTRWHEQMKRLNG